jgi:hypothetical protein
MVGESDMKGREIDDIGYRGSMACKDVADRTEGECELA